MSDNAYEAMDAVRQLNLIREYAALALDALRDEHEGNFRFYVTDVADRAAALDRFVKGM